jgi:xanthine dehydrogenase YagS FAD-binding subunit
MDPFVYSRPDTADNAVREGVVRADAHITAPVQFLAGGTTLIDLMKLSVMRPTHVVDIKQLRQDEMRRITVSKDGVRLGALVTMAQAADHPDIKRDYPVVAQSLQFAASAQLRNMASLGGNVLQRTRCPYFRDVSYAKCNKRNPGSGCQALESFNRQHAVLGTSEQCIATYPGDWAQALIALDAQVETLRQNGSRKVAFADLHKAAGTDPHIETVLEPGELITAFFIPAGPHTRRSLYLKIRDRESYEFALASAAVALDMEGDKVRGVRLALGGIATKPWRAKEAEQALVGKTLDESTARQAAEAALNGAKGHEDNAFKIPLAKETIVRALLEARSLEI